ncbi:Dcp1p-Dcp2p decapping enzyme complex alpha subunit [Exophiala sideris]|uniref:mRNA-capping enzyme subunit alpha n=1 Tax=Exophiala sideris TaxID=1016849 RepID=A0ABR0IYE9_9EURO|nr:Dcp1p-Dcp2p decapping enzyme complex alpha subunit [Exophiala sideris]KAK5052177.1 Dcp1p-Dcp2p decapping enzyme complex alpha subunit [Exophiala sideris]
MDPHSDPKSLIREFQKEVADLLHRHNRSFPGAQPVSFAAKHIQELKSEDYYVCEKTDGLRYLMYLTQDGDRDIHYLIDRKNDYYYVPGLHFPHHEDPKFNRFHTNTILDGELVEDRYSDREPVIKFLVFDLLVLDNNSLMQRSLDKRLAYFQSYVLNPYKAMVKQSPGWKQPFVIEDKATEFSYALEKMFREIIPKVKLLHGNDGLIFTCKNTPYKSGTDEHILKWKPPSENTVDFLLHIQWAKIEPDPDDPDQSPQDDYYSFPTAFGLYIYHGNDGDYAHVGNLHVEPAEWEEWKHLNRPLQDCIVECYQEDLSQNHQGQNGNGVTNGTPTPDSRRWRFHRFRDDKTDANHVTTFTSVIESIEDHVTEEDLLLHADEIRTAWKNRDAENKKRAAARGSHPGPK